ncbi:hypothetical protein EDD16DRAFT_1834230 [Pisolithus croceorrhizus]|nr:hypothetical protein EDD16DRAFT_1834230 [Pisolithus croceorrhizus]
MGGPVAPYIYRGEEPVSLVVQLLAPPLRGKTRPTNIIFPDLCELKGEKRAFEEADSNVVELVKRAKLATMSASSLAQPETFITLHKKPGELILDHRRVHNPEESCKKPSDFVDNLPPVSVHYKGFGHFLEVFRGSRDVPVMESVDSESLRLVVDELAESMSLIYENEQVRERRGLDALDDIFSARDDDLPVVVMGTNDSNSSNSDLGYFLGQRRAAYCIAEFKNESGCGSVIPYVEMTGRFAHSMKEAAERLNSASVMRGWNFPCLGIAITGMPRHYITFYAIIFAQQWRVVSLMPGLSCIRASGDGDDRTALYNAFTAASVLLTHIQEDATKLVHNPPPIEESSHVLPPISSLRHPHFGTHVEFKILELFRARAASSYVYSAKTTDGKPIMVKLARRYSYELHMFCVDRGYAPALLGFERLPGGFFCIAMEFVQSALPISQFPHIERYR